MEALDINVRFKLISTNISSISRFDGERDALLNFIERIDSMVPILDTFPLEYRILIMGSIKDKITGNARRSLLVNGNADNWPEIKQILIDNHGEKDSVDELIDKIRTCRCDSTIENFYKKLNTLLCRLNNALYFSNTDNSAINADSNARIALHSFKHGLPEPVRSIIISRNPTNLKEAFDIIKKNGYLKYTNNMHCSANSGAQNSGNARNVENNIADNRRQQRRQYNNSNNNNNNHLNREMATGTGTGNESGTRPNSYQQQAFTQSRRTYNSTNQAGRQNSCQRTNGNVNGNVTAMYRSAGNSQNVNSNYAENRNQVESMEIGTNETDQNFQTQALENYPI